MGKVITALGPISSDDLGITLPHEHLLLDLTAWWEEPVASKKHLVDAPITIEILGELRRDFLINKDNLKLDDKDLASEELAAFKKSGGKSLVDVTSIGLGRDPLALREISLKTGVNIVVGTGFYIGATHPSYVEDKSVDELADIMVEELTEGIGDTGIKAGLIGEIGCSDPLTQNEMKVLEAAGRAQSQTGAALTIHVGVWNPETKEIEEIKKAGQYLDLVIKGGGDPAKVYLSHMDITCLDTEYHESIIDEYGAILDYDNTGVEFYFDSYYPGARGKSDRMKQEVILRLLQAGYEKHLMLSNDVCTKIQLKKYGGYGYAHILDHIIPALKYAGATDKQINTMITENPKRILPF